MARGRKRNQVDGQASLDAFLFAAPEEVRDEQVRQVRSGDVANDGTEAVRPDSGPGGVVPESGRGSNAPGGGAAVRNSGPGSEERDLFGEGGPAQRFEDAGRGNSQSRDADSERDGGQRRERGHGPVDGPNARDNSVLQPRLPAGLGESEGRGNGPGQSAPLIPATSNSRFIPASQEALAPSGAQARFRANMAALRVLRELQEQDRAATDAERSILARWGSWGASGVAEVFDETHVEYEADRAELRELLSDEEYRAASRTVINAHYTDPALATEIWQALNALGFDGGRVLEPGSGAGTFIGLAPEKVHMTGVELDPVTAGISQALYPEAEIRAESFAKTRLPGGYFDAAVGNVPFARTSLHDPRHNAGNYSMHNHFIIKSLDLTRPGGVVGVISSAFTLDAQNPAARRKIYETADLLGAVRLPNGAHRRAAGTEALTDVLIFRRRLPGEEPLDPQWLDSRAIAIGDDSELSAARMNAYFVENPHRVLGEPVVGHGMYGAATLTVRNDDLRSVPARLHDQLQDIAQSSLDSGRGATERQEGQTIEAAAIVPAGSVLQIGHITAESDGTFSQVGLDGAVEPMSVPKTQARELRSLLQLRDLARSVLSLEASNVEDTTELGLEREKLREAYSTYAETFGPINRFTERRTGRTNDAGNEIMARLTPKAVALLRNDPFGPLVPALENFDEASQTAAPAALLRERQVQPRQPILGVDTPAEALAVTLDTRGEVDLNEIAQLLGIEPAAAREALGELVYDIPGELGAMETRAEYLSGNIREKLDKATEAAADDERFTRNVDDLKAVMPLPLGADEIEARIGSIWIDPEVHQDFLRQILLSPHARVDRVSGANWDVQVHKHTFAARHEWGTERMPAGEIFKNLLEQKRVQVTDPDPENPEGGRRVVNPTETTAAQEKAQMMQERFGEWVWENPERAVALTDEYNRRFNSLVLRDYTVEGDRLTLPGLVKDWTPRPHQRAAVARMISEPSVGLFHEVGAGKTAEMVMGSMELRRLGMARKPAVVVPNHMLDQFAREWLQIYPQAQILAASSADLAGDKRRQFVARAAANDWDAVIMTRTAFERIPLSIESEAEYLTREVDRKRQEIMAAKERAAASGGRAMSIKKLEARLQSDEEKIKRLRETPSDPGITFEQTGIDYLIVDELHDFKNLSTASNIQDAAIDGSKRASDLHAKVEYLRSVHGDRVITGATATPIANSVTEMYVMQRYLRPDLMEKAGIHDFDTWAATFGQVVSEMEMTVAGGDTFKMKERFAKFQNVPELLKMFHTFADVKTAEDLQLPVPAIQQREDGARLPRMVMVEPTPELVEYIAAIGERAEAVQQRIVLPTEDNMLKISSDGRKAALDMRLVDPELEMQEAPTKISAAADLIAGVYEDNKERIYTDPKTGDPHPTPGALQIVFCDLGTPSDKWNVYGQLRDDLVQRGVPEHKVRFMHEAKNDAEKGRLFAACRTGDVAVLVGSTQKMGVGTNIQDRAVHLVDMDAPWRPADVSQRHGRIVRQGNQNPEVAISQVVTKGSFDTFMWQTLERKSKFIDQIMRGRLDVREIEDVGDNTLSFAEVKAISSGNPLILEKSKADQELSRLERLNRAWNRNQASLVYRKDGAQRRGEAMVARLPKLKEAAARTTPEVGGEAFRMTIAGRNYDKRAEAVEAWKQWADSHAAGRPPIAGSRDLGIMAKLGGHDIRFVQESANMTDMGSSRVTLRIDDAPGVSVEVSRTASLFPTTGLIQRLENQVLRLPEEVSKQEQRIEEARQEYRDASAALRQPFKHTEALEAARWEVERIGRAMRGEKNPEPTLDPQLDKFKRLMSRSFPSPPVAGHSAQNPANAQRTESSQRDPNRGGELGR
ncbi:helicase [Arthrobacter sp. zg-ZUI122]|nr:helicase [Arthrobacter sunyaminii]